MIKSHAMAQPEQWKPKPSHTNDKDVDEIDFVFQ